MRASLERINQGLMKALMKQQQIIIEALAHQPESAIAKVPTELLPLLKSEGGVVTMASATIVVHDDLTGWLQAVKAAAATEPHTIEGSDVQVVELDSTFDPVAAESVDPAKHPGATNAIFIRDCYPQLLDAMWLSDRDKVALIGNPGTGKSYLQAYIIYHLLKDPSKRGSIKCVIRQTAGPEGNFFLFLLEEGKVFQALPAKANAFLAAFKPDECLYLFEPARDKVTEPSMSGGMRTIATVSPLADRIKEFRKQGGIPLYMPTWEESELLAVAKYVREKRPDDKKLAALYADDAVRALFKKYGGIFRYVLPTSEARAQSVAHAYKEAMASIPHDLFTRETVAIDSPKANISNFYMRYVVNETFDDYTLEFTNERVRREMLNSIKRADYEQSWHMLRGCNLGYLPERGRDGLEHIAPMLWAHPTDQWLRIDEAPNIDLPQFLEVREVHPASLKNWTDLEEGVLYIPRQSNFEFVEGFFVCRNLASQKVLHCFQAKSGKTTEKADVTKAGKLRARLGMSPTDPMHVWYITLPCDALQWAKTLSIPVDETKWADQLGSKPSKPSKHNAATGAWMQQDANETEPGATIIRNTTFGLLTLDFDRKFLSSDPDPSAAEP